MASQTTNHICLDFFADLFSLLSVVGGCCHSLADEPFDLLFFKSRCMVFRVAAALSLLCCCRMVHDSNRVNRQDDSGNLGLFLELD